MKAHSIANKQASNYVARRSLFKGSHLFSEMRGNAFVPVADDPDHLQHDDEGR